MEMQELLDAIEGKPQSHTEQQLSDDKELSTVKGQPREVLTLRQAADTSVVVYMGEHNAASIQILCTGTTPVATFTVQGARGGGGNWDTLPDAQAVQSGLTAGKIFDVLCGQAYLRISLSAVTGTYSAGQGWTVIVTPYMAPGQATVTAVQGAAGAAAWPVHDDWAPVLVADVTDDDSDKTITVPASTEYQPLSILVDLTTSADVGNRQLAVLVTTAADVVIAEARAGIVQAASLTRRYVVGVGNPDLISFRDTDLMLTALPVLVLPAGYKIRVYDKAAIAAAADDMHVQLLVMSRAV